MRRFLDYYGPLIYVGFILLAIFGFCALRIQLGKTAMEHVVGHPISWTDYFLISR